MIPNPTATDLLRECIEALENALYDICHLDGVPCDNQLHNEMRLAIEHAAAFLAEAEKQERK